MTESNFPFIKNTILRQNLDEAFDHIVTLLPFTESTTYNTAAKSSFRKTIIIFTASIVEALLFHILDNELTDKDITTFSWEFKNKKIMYIVDDSYEIVAGDYKKVSNKTDKQKLNLAQICVLLKEKKILNSILFQKIDEIRVLRNDQHIGPHTKVKSYSKTDLEKAFFVASEVKSFVKVRM